MTDAESIKKIQEIIGQINQINDDLDFLSEKTESSYTASNDFIAQQNKCLKLVQDKMQTAINLLDCLSECHSNLSVIRSNKNQSPVKSVANHMTSTPPTRPKGIRPRMKTGLQLISLTEDFTKIKPDGFILQGQLYPNINTWRQIWIELLNHFRRNRPILLRDILTFPDLSATFSSSSDRFRECYPIDSEFYANIHGNANCIRDRIKKVLYHLQVDPNEMEIFVRN